MLRKKAVMFTVTAALFAGLASSAGAPAIGSAAILGQGRAAAAGAGGLALSTLSTRPSLVTGSEVLVRVGIRRGARLPAVRVWLNGRDVTSVFRATSRASLTGLVTGLRLGRNILYASARRVGGLAGELTIIDHPITGPVFSGPQQQPFICQTQTFTLPVTGGTLGPPAGRGCAVRTRVDYVYRSTDGQFKPLPNPGVRPADLAQTTTSTGRRVNYIVRVETGTINRAIYQIAMLDDPVTDPMPTWYQHPAGWNGRLLYDYDGGCAPGYHQGNSMTSAYGGGVLNNVWLSKGYAAASSTLNVSGNDCNSVLSAETTMLVKEHFTDEYGVPRYTIGWGVSGGAIQQYMIAETYPGLLNGIVPQLSFPDALTFFTPISDCHLLTHYFAGSSLHWTAAQEAAADGWGSPQYCSTVTTSGFWALAAAGLTPRIPVTGCDAPYLAPPAVPSALIYNPVTNPSGARCDYWDNMVNVFGRNPLTGFALRTLDNVGVQYGLDAFQAGQISAAQFLDLNRRIGGYDNNGGIVPSRTVADPQALRIAYQTGQLDEGGGGLASVPIIDFRAYNDEIADPHDSVRTQTMRDRLIRANGTAANQVTLETPSYGTKAGAALFTSLQPMLLQAMGQWLQNITNDHAPASGRLAKVIRDKPSKLADGCYTNAGAKITGQAACRKLYPVHGNPRIAAGEPVTNDYLKCQLTPVHRADYPRMTDTQFAQLKAVFPTGVCDYRQPPAGLAPLKGTWLSYPSPGHSAPAGSPARLHEDAHPGRIYLTNGGPGGWVTGLRGRRWAACGRRGGQRDSKPVRA